MSQVLARPKTRSGAVKTFSGLTGPQDEGELRAFIELLQAENVQSYAEVGSLRGDTFHRVMCALPDGSKGVALDLPQKSRKYGETEALLHKAIVDLCARGYSASVVLGDSRATATIKQFRGRGPFDAILIDAKHTLEYVTADWENYRSAARIVAFHDIVGPRPNTKKPELVQVRLLWAAIKRQGYRTQEFVTPGSGMGIGVVWMG